MASSSIGDVNEVDDCRRVREAHGQLVIPMGAAALVPGVGLDQQSSNSTDGLSIQPRRRALSSFDARIWVGVRRPMPTCESRRPNASA